LPSEFTKDNKNFRIINEGFLNYFEDKNEKNRYDVVATSFFIDKGVNIYEMIEMVHSVLKKGGVWINSGPF